MSCVLRCAPKGRPAREHFEDASSLPLAARWPRRALKARHIGITYRPTVIPCYRILGLACVAAPIVGAPHSEAAGEPRRLLTVQRWRVMCRLWAR
ncbi:hypothetical protein TSOC_008862 [Tetrabaena socialis]|uniref:Uncharacterized protein n=1 Tax=Tetrabaena socialis TaxID=47790 RepID=A0A2J7ZXA2_9CHLO|nr:hypothetical protein TSOC_008862 [Tetrabaena socialis]|eukprot:PNH04899.1 hypothetical protein TSOC_008862 [Tetrabaena socialis]